MSEYLTIPSVETPSRGIIVHQHRRGSVTSSATSNQPTTRETLTALRPPSYNPQVNISQAANPKVTKTRTFSIQLTCALNSVNPNNKMILISNA